MPSSNEISGLHPRTCSAFLIENQLLVESCLTVDGEAAFRLPIKLANFDAKAEIFKARLVETTKGRFLRNHW